MQNINRREFLNMIAGSAMAAAIPSTLTWAKSEETKRPNIIFLLTDDHRADAMGCAGNPIIRTPNMDKMAAQGVRFPNAFVTTSICAASRASFFTGTYYRKHGHNFELPPISKELTDNSYGKLLRKAGYRTGFIGKFGVEVENGKHGGMFDYFYPLTHPYFQSFSDDPYEFEHVTYHIGKKTNEFLRDSAKSDKPFCLSVSFWAPHAEDHNPQQYVWPWDVDNLYRDVKIPKPKKSDPEFFEKQPDFIKKSLNRTRWHWRNTPEKNEEMTKGYYRMVTAVDNTIGKIREELEKLGLDDNTVIIMMGDNGMFLGERGLAGKWLMYEESIKVPLIVYDPRAPKDRCGITPHQMALNVDIAPTILDIAGVDIPKQIQGRTLVPLLKGQKVGWRPDFLYEYLWFNDQIVKCEGLRTLRWKYTRYPEHNYEELYDLNQDPEEIKNLAGDPRFNGVIEAFQQRIEVLIKEAAQ